MPFNWDRPAIAASPISAVVPAHRAEQALPALLDALVAQMEKLQRDYEVIVVVDSADEATASVTQEWTAKNPRIQCLTCASSDVAKVTGYGTKLRAGLAAARHPLVVTMPADGGYRPADLPALLAGIDEVDIVCGCRKPPLRVNAQLQSWPVYLGSGTWLKDAAYHFRPWLKAQLQGWPVYLVFGPWLKDAACHFRLYRRNVLTRIPLQSESCFVDVELLAKANFLDCLFTEVEVQWQPAAEPAYGPGPSMFADAWRLFHKPVFGPSA